MVTFANTPHPSYDEQPPSLAELLSYQHPDFAKLTRLIEQSPSYSFRQITFAPHLLKRLELHPEIPGQLEGATLLDLGCGWASKVVAHFAKEAGARHYVGVDLFMERNLEDELNLLHHPAGRMAFEEVPLPDTLDELQTRSFRCTLVRADLLHFLSKMSSDSASILLCGFDQAVLRNPVYHAQLALEIARVADPGGIVLGSDSEAIRLLRCATGLTPRSHSPEMAEWLLPEAATDSLGCWADLLSGTQPYPWDDVLKKLSLPHSEEPRS